MARLGADFLSAHSLRGSYPHPGLALVDSFSEKPHKAFDPTLKRGPNRHVVPGRGFWRRPGSSGRWAGLKSIAPLWVEGSPSPGGSGQVRDRGPVQHGG